MEEKEILLKEVSEVIEEESVSFSLAKNIIIAVFFTLTILFPKVYVANKIYIYSLKINKLLNEYYSLKAEQSILNSKIEKIKLKNRLQRISF